MVTSAKDEDLELESVIILDPGLVPVKVAPVTAATSDRDDSYATEHVTSTPETESRN